MSPWWPPLSWRTMPSPLLPNSKTASTSRSSTPRTLEPLDLDTILASVEKTGRLVIVDEDRECCGFAAELGFQVMEKAYELLDAPIQRVCTP